LYILHPGVVLLYHLRKKKKILKRKKDKVNIRDKPTHGGVSKRHRHRRVLVRSREWSHRDAISLVLEARRDRGRRAGHAYAGQNAAIERKKPPQQKTRKNGPEMSELGRRETNEHMQLITNSCAAQLPLHLDAGIRLYADEYVGNRADVRSATVTCVD
jgi:hypothetical protein